MITTALVGVAVVHAAFAKDATAAEKPTTVLFVADDWGAREQINIPTANGPVTRKIPSSITSHIDQLAADGINYVNGYAAPMCAQARTRLMTGLWQQRKSVGGQQANGPPPNAAIPMLPKVLAGLGYGQRYLIGKWHLGTSAAQGPIGKGFTRWFGFYGATPPYNYTGQDKLPNGDDIRLLEQNAGQGSPTKSTKRGRTTVLLTDEAVRLLQQAGGQPVFLEVAWTATHDPFGPGDTLSSVAAEMDTGVGRIVAAAPANTLFVWIGDNGRGGKGTPNKPLAGGKYSIQEGGVRVPFYLHWTGHLPSGAVSRDLVDVVDLAPTIAAAAGGSFGRTDGINLLGGVPAGRAVLQDGTYSDPDTAVRVGDWKLYLGAGTADPRLYNLWTNIGETNNVAGANPGVVADLKPEIAAFRAALND